MKRDPHFPPRDQRFQVVAGGKVVYDPTRRQNGRAPGKPKEVAK